MLYYLGELLLEYFGPLRLFTSYLFLNGIGLMSCWILSWWLLPKFANKLPSDRGKIYAVQPEAAKGKPTGAGIIVIIIYLFIMLLVVPFDIEFLIIMACILFAMIFGYLDDKSEKPWSEYLKGFFDLVISLIAACTLYFFKFQHTEIWLPFTKVLIKLGPDDMFSFAPLIFITGATLLIWIIINAINCTDGIDGLSGALSIIALLGLGVILYFVIGHTDISKWLLLPHYPDGAKWATMAFSMIGCLAGYLWHNAYPSSMLMGDAGSRALGLLIGVLVINTGNPFIILTVATVVIVNGGTGLIKVALLRFFKIGIFHNVRFPLHDHFRHNKGWSNTQVLIRFTVLQSLITIILVVFFIKIR
jgi:phospho-N-acetylmuramoyl-pentapeptide-transferase